MSETFKEDLQLEIKKYYYKAFRRRGKTLQTLELIQECSEDQFKLFVNQIANLIKKSLKINDEVKLYKLLVKLKKIEGCNKKIMKLILAVSMWWDTRTAASWHIDWPVTKAPK